MEDQVDRPSVPMQVFTLPGEDVEDVRHALTESRGNEQYCLRIALALAFQGIGDALGRWKEHQIELEKWCHLGPIDEELAKFRLEIQQTFLAIPWLFSVLVRRVQLGRTLSFQDMAGFDVANCVFLPCQAAVLYDSFANATILRAQMPPLLQQVLSETVRGLVLGVPFMAGAMLERAIEWANQLGGIAAQHAAEHPLNYDTGGYLPV